MKDENKPSEIIGVVAENKHMGLDVKVWASGVLASSATGHARNDGNREESVTRCSTTNARGA